MLNTLTGVYGYRRENILLLISDYGVVGPFGGNATRTEMIDAIDWLKQMVSSTLETDDEVVFFYSGHGARGRANDRDKEAIDEAIVSYECTAESLIWDGELKTLFSGFSLFFREVWPWVS